MLSLQSLNNARLKFFAALLVFWYFALFSTSVLAAEQIVVTQQELNQLSEIISESRRTNQRSQADLKAVKELLLQSQTELNQAQAESEQLRSELTLLSNSSRQQTADLQKANNSLQTYADEMKSKLNRQQKTIKRQRTLIYILLGVGAVYVLRT